MKAVTERRTLRPSLLHAEGTWNNFFPFPPKWEAKIKSALGHLCCMFMHLLSCINSTLQPHRWEQCKKNVLNTSKGGHYSQLIVTSRHRRFFQYTRRVLKVKETKSRREVQTALSFTTGFPLDILDAQRYTPQHHVIALEQYPEALDVSSSSMHKANSHMASPGCFLFLYRRDSLCRPRLRDRQPPTEAHQRRPPTAAKGNWLGLHRGTAAKRNFAASWVHKELIQWEMA